MALSSGQTAETKSALSTLSACFHIRADQRLPGVGAGSCPGFEQIECGERHKPRRSGQGLQSADKSLARWQAGDLRHALTVRPGNESGFGKGLRHVRERG